MCWPCPPRHHGHSFPGQAGQASYIWIAATECWVMEQPATSAAAWVSTSPIPALVTTGEEGSTLCNVSVICVGNVGIICSYVDRCRTVLVMSDMKARLTSRVVPPYTSYTGHTVAAAAAW